MARLRLSVGPFLLIAAAISLVTSSAVAQRGRTTKRPHPAMKIAAGPKRITPHQRENAQARIDLAMVIVRRFDAEAQGRGLAAGWQQPALETLLPLSLKALQRVSEQAGNLDSLAAAAAAAVADPNLLGDPNEDLVYTAIAPCRFIDTRLDAGGPINGTRDFDVDVTGATYGGSASCNPTATLGASGDVIGAIAANLTIVGPELAPGFLAVKPTAASPLSSLLNWYEAGASVQVANAGIFATANGVANFTIQTSASTHVIMDILGAFIEPEATALQTTSLSSDGLVIPNNDSGCDSSPACPAGYALTGGGCGTDEVGHMLENSEPASTSWFCCSSNQSGGDSILNAFAVCSRVPGR